MAIPYINIRILLAGDDGVTGYAFRQRTPLSQCGYFASWPASSPYVTAVGGTMNGLGSEYPEIAASAATNCDITTGIFM